MSELIKDLSKASKPPDWPAYLAMLLELAMVGTFILYHAWVGIFLAFVYSWFSATRAMLFDLWKD